MTRVAMVGFDAAELDLVNLMMDEGKLPNLARMRARGLWARLDDSLAYRHGMIFPQFVFDRRATLGVDWEDIGFDGSTYLAVQRNASMYSGRVPFFNRESGRRTIAFDVPAMCLGHAPRAVEVIGWGASAPRYPRSSRPKGLLREIDTTFGPHPAWGDEYEVGWWGQQRIEVFIGGLVAGLRRRVEICRWLQDRYPDWEMFVTVWSEPHGAGEYLWHALARDHPLADVLDGQWLRFQLERVYVALDEALGAFAAALPPDCALIAFAPYGIEMGSGDAASIALLPELLHRWHFGEALLRSRQLAEWRSTGMPVVVPDPDQDWHEAMNGLWAGPPTTPGRAGWAGTRERLRRFVSSPTGTVRSARDQWSKPATAVLGSEIPAETHLRESDIALRPSAPMSWLFTDRYRPYWPQMSAFALPTARDAVVRVNLRGREAHGTVDPGDYSAVLREVEELVAACDNPRTGAAAAAEFVRLRTDPYDASGPDGDLLIRWSGPIDAFAHPQHGLVGPVPLHRTGAHSPHGFAVVTGPGIDHADLGTRSVLDLPPTALALVGERADASPGSPLTRSGNDP